MDAVKKMTLIAAAVGAITIQGSAFAADGTISFTGTVIDSGCKVAETPNGGTMTIPMGSFSKASFTDVGSKSAQKNFSLTLTECPSGKGTVLIRFSGTADTANNNLIALTPGGATGLALGFTGPDGNDLSIQKDSSPVTITNNAATLNLQAFYQRTGTINSGDAKAVAYFTLTYP